MWLLEVTPEQLEAAIDEGYISRDEHPAGTTMIMAGRSLAEIILQDCGGMRIT